MIRESIAELVDGQALTHDEAHGTLREIMNGEATHAQIASFITVAHSRRDGRGHRRQRAGHAGKIYSH